MNESGKAKTVVYAGHRSASSDALYSKEFASLGSKLRYRVAYSRDGEEGKARIYVQDLIQEDGEEMWKMLDGERKAWILISGYVLCVEYS